jgi:tetratricopeptide (TPR) repeat protein
VGQGAGYARSVSPRARVLAVVAAVAVLVVAAVVAGALLQGDGKGPEAQRPAPPLHLGIFPGESHARELISAESDYERGEREAALREFRAVLREDPTSIEAAVGAALAGWPEGSLDRLRALVASHPRSGVARLHLGLALGATGDRPGAEREWREAEARDPDTPAALEAESLLHPNMAPGRPFFIMTAQPPASLQSLGTVALEAALRRRAERGGAADWLVLGTFLQRIERSVSARRAYDRALELAPDSLEARTAGAVVRFDKDDPADAFSRLGPLARRHPRSSLVRFHLGLMLLWIRAVDAAKKQLELATQGNSQFHARQAEDLLSRLS